MSHYKNGVEALLPSQDANDFIKLPATAADVIEKDAFIYWDTSGNVAKKFTPTDATDLYVKQNLLIGIASAGKKAQDTEIIVCVKAKILIDATNCVLGQDFVILYSLTSYKYSAYEGALYNTDYNPDITLTGSFAVAVSEGVDAVGKGEILIDGHARLALLT